MIFLSDLSIPQMLRPDAHEEVVYIYLYDGMLDFVLNHCHLCTVLIWL